MLVNMKEILGKARAEGYGVGFFNAVNVEMARAVIETAEALGEAIGREYRSSVCVTEPGLAEKIQTYIDTNSGN